MDQRIRISKKMLKEALMELLKTEPLAKISIKEICEKADINRGTFYKYYIDKYSLCLEVATDFTNEVIECIKSEEDAVLKILNIVKNNDKYAVLLSKTFDDPTVPIKLYKSCNVEKIIREHFFSEFDKDDETISYLISYMCAGFYAIVVKWIYSGFALPIEQVASSFCRIDFSLNDIKGC